MFKVNNNNSHSGVFIVNLKHISHLFCSVSIVCFQQVNVSWKSVALWMNQFFK